MSRQWLEPEMWIIIIIEVNNSEISGTADNLLYSLESAGGMMVWRGGGGWTQLKVNFTRCDWMFGSFLRKRATEETLSKNVQYHLQLLVIKLKESCKFIK